MQIYNFYIKFGRVPLVIVAEPSTSENTFNDLPYFVWIFTKLIGFSTSKYIKQFLKGKSLKFNMLMCWCIGKAASGVKEFHILPVGDKLIRYDSMVIGTSALARYEIEIYGLIV